MSVKRRKIVEKKFIQGNIEKNPDKNKNRNFVTPFKDKSQNIDPFEKEKTEIIKIKQALEEFSKDNLID
jgi:hypothetical protein